MQISSIFNRESLAIIGSCLLYLVVGVPYCWGTLGLYITQYLNQYSTYQYDITETNFTYPLICVAFFIGLNMSARLVNHYGSRKIMFMAILGSSLSICSSSFAKNFFLFAFFFGFGNGLFASINYFIPIYVMNRYFPLNRGKYIGICLAFYGFSSIICQFIIIYIVNPNDIPLNEHNVYPSSILEQVPKSLRYISLYVFVLGTFSSIILKNKKKSQFSLFGENIDQSEYQKSKINLNNNVVYQLIIMKTLSLTWGYYILANFKNYGQNFNYKDQYLSLVVGNLALFSNGAFRVLFGFLYDKFKFKTTFNLILVINIVICCTLDYAAHNPVTYAIWVMIAAIAEGSVFVVFSAEVLEQFGKAIGPMVYSRICLCIPISNTSQALIMFFLSGKIDNRIIFYIFAGLQFIAIIFNNYFYPQNLRKLLKSIQKDQNLIDHDSLKIDQQSDL